MTTLRLMILVGLASTLTACSPAQVMRETGGSFVCVTADEISVDSDRLVVTLDESYGMIPNEPGVVSRQTWVVSVDKDNRGGTIKHSTYMIGSEGRMVTSIAITPAQVAALRAELKKISLIVREPVSDAAYSFLTIDDGYGVRTDYNLGPAMTSDTPVVANGDAIRALIDLDPRATN